MELIQRPRRLRASMAIRGLVRETVVETGKLVWPMFVSEKITERRAVSSMPGVFQYPLAPLIDEAERAHREGIGAVLIFGIPEEKDEEASQAYAANGIVQRAIKELKARCPELVIISDVCLCEFMSHGHCGVTRFEKGNPRVDNDASVELLARTAVSHAAAGADVVAPSDMMDGRIGAIRVALDDAGFQDTVIMSYAAKFASAFYGPFREAAESAPREGDRKSYQMDPANVAEALREVALDLEQGADIVLIKPGLPYLDILSRVKERFDVPTAVYNVSGEYAMIKAAVANGWLDEKNVVLEQMTAFKRAGADLIITYWARDVLGWLRR